MNLNKYANTLFIKDLDSLKLQKPSAPMLDGNDRADHKTKFFGGKAWEFCERDIKYIKPENKKYFCICLFTMVCADETMFTYYRTHYNAFRRKIVYPKFGWSGFGFHFESPKYLLTVPVEFGVDFSEVSNEELEEFIINQFAIAVNFMPTGTTVKSFYIDMFHDADFHADAVIFERLKACMMKNLIILH
jgi:hypothetical protein